MKSVINLIQTAQGYSILENGHEVNKSVSKTKEKSYSLGKSNIEGI
jgi:hypothetical protein